MTLPRQINDRERDKFNEVAGEVAVKVSNPDGSSIGTIFAGLSIPTHDYIGVTYPTSTTEEYVYKIGGSGGTTVATVTVVYTSSTKVDLSSVTKT